MPNFLLFSIFLNISLPNIKASEPDTLIIQAILNSWSIHQSKNLLLLKDIKAESLKDTSASGGRDVAHQILHMIEVRAAWLKQFYPDSKNDFNLPNEEITIEYLNKYMILSAEWILAAIKKGLYSGDIPNYNHHPVIFLAYLVSHESHHRGQIILSLKQSKHPIRQRTGFALWDWQ